ncbi:uncharacterized protein LOC114471166 isoform X2 [Gouania willdenowi]|uniref:uncharacterized protein LOC114471166 isoform X2 n=1 Tax=Gouania willdenowi TaxID=441366 RepID=UPI001056688F|nr:uncharacterized protein LOC114471166 isoform X2 [Gouania willdenowi]
MWLAFLTLCGFLFSSSAADEIQEKCYGNSLTLPSKYAPAVYKGQLYFTPSNGGPQRLMLENGKAKDRRLDDLLFNIYIRDLRVEDEGYFSVSHDGIQQFRILTLKVLDCADEVHKHYGDTYTYRVPSKAEFLEFTPLKSSDQLKILWNRSDSSVSSNDPDSPVRAFSNDFYWERRYLTQKHNGYYNFREKHNILISRLHLKVEENEDSLIGKVGRHLRITFPWARDDWIGTFRPESDPDFSMTIKRSRVPKIWFEDRIQVDSDGMDIDPVESSDAGIFEFRDEEGNLAWVLDLKVEDDNLTGIKYAAVAAVILLAVVTCCCCYCKRRRRKRELATPALLNYTTETPAASPAAPPAVHHRGRSQPPTYTTASVPPASTSQTVNSHASNRTTDTSHEPPVYNPVSIHLNPSQREMSVPTPPISSGFLTSDAELRFELKGMTSPSSLPLSSESTVCDVYNSDKLNFR